MTYYLQLGRLVDLSLLELQHLFDGFSLHEISGSVYRVECDEEALLQRANRSGGIIKVMETITTVPTHASETIIIEIVKFLQTLPKPIFGLHEINRPENQAAISPQSIKNALKELDRNSRFIEAPTAGLSASVLLHQNVDEMVVIYTPDAAVVTRSCWVQNIDDWTRRDRYKPERDVKRGMLPPKLARMMINFVSPSLLTQPTKTLLDPFCGTGTILMEGMMTGWDVMGSDLSPEAIRDTAANMYWFAKAYEQKEPLALFVQDATKVTTAHLKDTLVDAIITEPFLGKQNPTVAQLPGMFKGLEKLYLGALKNWTKILHDGGEVVIVTPLVIIGPHHYSLEKIIDKSTEFGYNRVSGPLIYNREQTTIQRAIYVLKYIKKK